MNQNNKHFQSILKIINKLIHSHDTWEVFYDFLEMCAISISNILEFNSKRHEEKENQYLGTIKKYTPEHQILFSEMFGELILALEYEYQTRGFTDILGNLFHELELHNKYKGQFFTPQHVCTLMAKMTIGSKEHSDKIIHDKGYFPVLEPTIGSGAMVLGFANAMKEYDYNHSQQLFVIGVDIDLKCVFMSYLQLSLYGIPAVVVHGNSLTNEEWSRWYTPAYVFGGWSWKRRKGLISADVAIEAEINAEMITKPISNNPKELHEEQKQAKAPMQQEYTQPLEQLDLFSLMDMMSNDNSEGK